MKYLMGIDIGTYESKGVLVDIQGHILAQATIPHDLLIPQPGWAEHDADEVWWHDFVYISRELLRQSGVKPTQIVGIGCSAIAPCVLPVDTYGRPLRRAILYGIDTRALDEINELTDSLGSDWIIAETGSVLSSQSAGPKILWIRRHEPQIWARTWKIMTATTYLVYRLTGRVVMDHYTAAAYGPLYSLRKLDWEPRASALICGIELLPELDWTTAIAGYVTPQSAMETGLSVGTPVIVGTADAAAEAVGAGAVAPGDMMLMYGTTMFFIKICASLPENKKGMLWSTVFLEPGIYALTAGMATAGALTRWFRDQFAQLELEGEKSGGRNAYAVLAEQANAIPPGAEGLLVLPYFSGERTPINDPLARGLIAGLTLSHTRIHIYRALLEGIAYGVRHNLEVMAEIGESPQRLIAIGGGTKNRVWLQIVSNVIGRMQEIRSTPGACYGDAFLAGVGVGLFPNIAAVKSWLQEPSDRIFPDPAAKETYDIYYNLYRKIYEKTKDIMHELAQLGAKIGSRRI